MSFTVTKITTRPSIEVANLKDSDNLDPEVATAIANINHAMRAHAAVQSRTVAVSGDGLTKTTTTVWENQAAFEAYLSANSADLAKIATAAVTYNKANGIAISTTTAGA